MTLDDDLRPKCLLQSCVKPSSKITLKGITLRYSNLIGKLLLENSLVFDDHTKHIHVFYRFMLFFNAAILKWANPLSKVFSASC